jgi:hypothetical protein
MEPSEWPTDWSKGCRSRDPWNSSPKGPLETGLNERAENVRLSDAKQRT